jgi:hypothetical protein
VSAESCSGLLSLRIGGFDSSITPVIQSV